MKLVAAAKLRRAQDRLMAARPYAQKIGELVESLSSRIDPSLNPLFSPPEGARKVLAVVMTSDRGLCGGFASNILKAVDANVRKWTEAGREVSLITAGRKGRDALRKRGYRVIGDHSPIGEITYEKAGAIASEAVAEYLKGETAEVHLIFSHFRSAMAQRPVVDKLLPFRAGSEPPAGVDFLYEPSRYELVEALLPRCIRFEVYGALLETFASEQGARMTAMDSATNNAAEIIGSLTLTMNKVRQAAITKELLDIINGAEALKR